MKTLRLTMGLSIFRILLILMLVALPAALILTAGVAHATNAGASAVETDLVWGDGINANTAHNTWYSAGRHWVAYVEDGDVWVESTADYGATWDATGVIDAGNTTFKGLATWYDEPNDILHMARVADGNLTGNISDVVYHSSYIPGTEGNLVVVQTEVAVEDGTYVDGDVFMVTIACDELGYPWIAWTEAEFLGNYSLPGYYWVEVSDSDANDGTWVESDADGWEEFGNDTVGFYGHDYDALYGVGNWSAIAVNLVPVNNEGDLMHLSWSIEDAGADALGDAGIDSTIWNADDEAWGNLSWIVPIDDGYGLYPNTMGEIAFSAYDLGAAIHFVYTDAAGYVRYNCKSQIEDWDEINGPGNWTEIKDVGWYAQPAIAGYDNPAGVPGEDLIVVVNTIGGLYYDTCPYSGNFTGTWTTIWEIPGGPDGEVCFLHSLQYKYGAGSPVGFAWDWGGLDWEGGTTGELDYWWIDQDGEDAGENPLGWYETVGSILSNYIALDPMVKIGPTLFLLGFMIAGIGLFIGGIGGMYGAARENKSLRTYILWGVVIVIAILMITIAYYTFPSLIQGAEQVRNL